MLNTKSEKPDKNSVNFDFNLTDPDIIDFIEERSFDFWEDISDTTKKKLKTTMETGLSDGLSLNDIANNINTNVFSELVDKGDLGRARKIARTETTIALNKGANEAYEQSGVVHKKSWLTSGDGVVRDSHIRAEGEGIIKSDKRFSNGLLYPGDTAGEIKELVNCRCSLVPEIDKKEAKRVNNILESE